MPVTVYRLPDEPVLIATFSGVIDRETLLTMYRRSDALLTEPQQQLYRISDFRHMETSIEEALRSLADLGMDMPGSPTDTRIRSVLLGSNKWSRIARDSVLRLHGIEIPLFETMREARRYIRVQIARSVS